MSRVFQASAVLLLIASGIGSGPSNHLMLPADPPVKTLVTDDLWTLAFETAVFSANFDINLELWLAGIAQGERDEIWFAAEREAWFAAEAKVRAVVKSAAPVPRPMDGSLRDRALAKFHALGAAQWQINVFDCIGWYESGWQNKQSPTDDEGVLQINRVHLPQLQAQGLNPWVPEDAATYSWQLSRQGTNFRPWTVHGLCGV